MRIQKTICFFLFTILFSLPGFSQIDTCKLRISLLTCSPGVELYSAWGHTAIRVIDSTTGMDMVLNYGTFDDSDPAFLAKFTKGIMNYALSAYPYTDFLNEYRSAGRGVIEQTLSLQCDEKINLYNALRINAMNENRFYKYFFSEDNCTTRAKEMIGKHTNHPISFSSVISFPPPSFRNLIHVYLYTDAQRWNKLGIDILLGSNLDKKVSNEQSMFLPENLLKGFDSAYINNKALVSRKTIVIPFPAKMPDGNGGLSPLILFSLLAIFILVLSFLTNHIAKKTLLFFDILFFLILGLLGTLLTVLWMIRIDDVCRNNFNLLWAIPTHFPVAFLLFKNKKWLKKYFKIIFLITALTGTFWWLIPQQFNSAVIPVLFIILLRSWQRSK